MKGASAVLSRAFFVGCAKDIESKEFERLDETNPQFLSLHPQILQCHQTARSVIQQCNKQPVPGKYKSCPTRFVKFRVH
jgi:hypothetical protein